MAVSAGNHGMALAWAAGARGVPVTVVMPEGASTYKAEACRGFGAEVVLHGDIHAAWARARELVAERGAILVPPYAEPGAVLGVAALLDGTVTLGNEAVAATVVTGGNLDRPLLDRVLG